MGPAPIEKRPLVKRAVMISAAIDTYLLDDHSRLHASVPAIGRKAVAWFLIGISFISAVPPFRPCVIEATLRRGLSVFLLN